MKVKVIKKIRLEFDESEFETMLGALSYTGLNTTNDAQRMQSQRLEEQIHAALRGEARQVNEYS